MVTGKTSCPTAHGKFMSNLIAACSLRDKDPYFYGVNAKPIIL